jgi:hypothetical protein
MWVAEPSQLSRGRFAIANLLTGSAIRNGAGPVKEWQGGLLPLPWSRIFLHDSHHESACLLKASGPRTCSAGSGSVLAGNEAQSTPGFADGPSANLQRGFVLLQPFELRIVEADCVLLTHLLQCVARCLQQVLLTL